MMKRFFILVQICLAGCLSCSLFAQDGGQLYGVYCGACHGQEGEGQAQAGIPPLSRSQWVAGDPRRIVQIVLHGISGPIEVNGKTYNAMMPAQGVMLSDDQLSAILQYVRTNWGNKGKVEITSDLVKTERHKTAQRTVPWEAIELLKQYPLPKEEVLITKVEARYQPKKGGEVKVVAADKLPQNMISLKAIGEPIKKGSVTTFTGEMTVKEDDVYSFVMVSAFLTTFEINGERIVQTFKPGNIRSAKSYNVSLSKGKHTFKLVLKRKHKDEIVFSWKSKKSPIMKNLVEGNKMQAWDTIELLPKKELYFYRGSLAGAGSSRVIAVGSPQKLHFTFDPITASPTLLWSGRFVDAGRHWTQRGSGLESPMGRAISDLGSGYVWQNEMPKKWPSADINEEDIDIRKRPLDYHGYKLDADRLGVTFYYSINDSKVSDHYRVVSADTLKRTLKHEGAAPLYLRLLEKTEKAALQELQEKSPFVIDSSTMLEVEPSDTKLTWIDQEPIVLKKGPKKIEIQRKAGVVEIKPERALILHYRRK